MEIKSINTKKLYYASDLEAVKAALRRAADLDDPMPC